MSDGCYRSDNEVEEIPTIHERLKIVKDNYNEATQRISELVVQLTILQLKLQDIKKEASSLTCVSYEYDPTPTAEERLKNIIDIINRK